MAQDSAESQSKTEQESIICQRCGDDEATSKFKLGANRSNAQFSSFKICDGCTRSLGEWFDKPEGVQ